MHNDEFWELLNSIPLVGFADVDLKTVRIRIYLLLLLLLMIH